MGCEPMREELLRDDPVHAEPTCDVPAKGAF